MATAERNDEVPNSAPLGAMGSLLRRLDMLTCTDDAGSLSELKDYIHSIRDNLKKLSEVQDPPLTVNYWMKHARELSYDIEAYLDGLDAQTEDSLNVSDAKEGGGPDDSYAKMKDCIDTECSVDDSHAEMEGNPDDSDANTEDSIDDSDEDETEETVDNSDSSMQDSICSSDYKISGFRTRAKGMIDRYEKFSLDSVLGCPTAATTIVSPRPSRDAVLVGMGNQITKLISLLQPKDENGNQLKIVSIFGDEGIGKSTLIQEIWRESLKEKKIWPEPESEVKVKRAFVQMGKKPDVRMILQSILSQVSQQEPAKDCGVTNLIHDIKKHLEQKRYFIIVDDVQSLSVWDVVGRAFPHGSFGSRIITTTSDKEVALACCGYVLQHNYIMEPLSVGDCKELFIRTVDMGTVDLQLSKQVLDKIERKYGGLPLAIIWTANLVASKLETEQGLSRSEKEQNLDFDVMKFLDEYLRRASTPVEILIQILKLCYSSLPHYLKTCLLYLSLYPENYLFLKKDLVKLWIAEGFICTSEEDKVEAAGRYFDVLVSLGLIQRMDINCNKQHQQGELVEDEGEEYPLTVPYIVHPTVFDFITSKSTEDNFVSIIDYSQLTVAFKEKIRRLSLHFGSATYATTPTSIGLSQVRTLSFKGLLSCMPSLVEFKLVRVLILHLWGDDGDKKFPLAEICKLLLLKYLQVRCNVSVELPGQIGRLKHLETLEINSIVTAVPSDVLHLSRLLHLRLGLKQNLTLGPVAAINVICSDELLPPMDDSSISTSTPSVQIFELVLPICIFSRLPKWIPQLQKLSILEIVVGELFTTDIDMLQDLPALTALSLYVRIPTAGNIVFRRGAFPALKYFRFMCDVLSLDFQEEAVPNLRRLNIGFNVHTTGQKYDNILVGFQHLLNIQDVFAIIGATMGMEETDRIAAESALKDAIHKHPRPIKFKVKRELHIKEEYHPRPDRLIINEQEVPVIHGPKTEDPTNEQPINLDKIPGKDTHGQLGKAAAVARAVETAAPGSSSRGTDRSGSPRSAVESSGGRTVATEVQERQNIQTLLTLLADGEEQARQLGEIMDDDPRSRAEHYRGAARRLQCTLGKAAAVARAVQAAAPGSSSQGTDRSDWPRSSDESSVLTTEVQEHQSMGLRRKGLPRRTMKLRVTDASLEATPDDGFSWRKYGQKDILGAMFSRGYYRCTYRTTQGCAATKQVQRSDTDLCVFDVTYQGEHTCHQKQRATVAAATAHAGGSQSPPPPAPLDQAPDPTSMMQLLWSQSLPPQQPPPPLEQQQPDPMEVDGSCYTDVYDYDEFHHPGDATMDNNPAAAAFSPPASPTYFHALHTVVKDGSCYADVYDYDE